VPRPTTPRPPLLVALTGKASPAKAAEGDEPVFAYIASLPQPQRGVAERIDALAAKTLPDLQRAVKWGMAYYGVGGGAGASRPAPSSAM
jgi:hypothetical protein